MKYLYIAAGILAVLIILLVIWVICFRRHARCKVRILCDEEKCRDLNRAIGVFGFQYDICQDIFYSKKDAWQREMGYGKIYDEHAISMGMVFDCEPLYFSCNGKSYLIELWKGQYGMSTGAEIGFYVSDEEAGAHPERLFYRSVSDEEMLCMRFVLRKKGRILMIREEKHWWLTGFVLGEFSHKEELGMEISITFRDCQMRNAFYDALLSAGYRKENICVNGASVRFSFTRPCHACPKHCRLRVWWVQWKNKRNCRRYRRVTRCFVRTIDKVDYLGMCFPWLYRLLGRCSRIPCKKKCRRRSV